jgi:hypothetical protein
MRLAATALALTAGAAGILLLRPGARVAPPIVERRVAPPPPQPPVVVAGAFLATNESAAVAPAPISGEACKANVFALSAAGKHEEATSLAAEAPDETRAHLLTAAYHTWALAEPEVALDAALMLDDPGRRQVAFHAAVSGWARRDPRQLAACAAAFPEGPERTFALIAALRAWRQADRDSAVAWMTAHGIAGRAFAVVWED